MKHSLLTRRTPLRPRGERACAPAPSPSAVSSQSGPPHGRAPLGRNSRLERRTRINPVNRERAAAKYELNFGPHADFIRAQRCLVPGCRRKGQAAHVHPRQMGGCGGDWRELVPLCGPYGHHEEQEGRTPEFEARYGLNLAAEAARYVILDPGVTEDELPSARVRLRGALVAGLHCPACRLAHVYLESGVLSCPMCGANSEFEPQLTALLAAVEDLAVAMETPMPTLAAAVSGKPRDVARLWAALADGGLS